MTNAAGASKPALHAPALQAQGNAKVMNRYDLICRLDNQTGLVGGQLAEVLVDLGAGFLEDAEGADQLARHPIVADGEVDKRAGRLSAVVPLGGHLDGTHTVRFAAGLLAHNVPALQR